MNIIIYYPLLCYLGLIIFAFYICGGIQKSLSKHILFFSFLLFILPYTIRVALTPVFFYDISALNTLQISDFIFYTLVYFACLFFLVLIYRISYLIFVSSKFNFFPEKIINNITGFYNSYSNILTKKLMWLGLFIYIVGLMGRFLILGDRANLVFTGKEEDLYLHREGGFTTLFGIFNSLVYSIYFIFLEFKNKNKAKLFFLLLCIPSFVSGSKGGILTLILDTVVYLILRGRLHFKAKYIILGPFIVVLNLTIGAYFRSLVAGQDATLSIISGISSGFNRYHGFELALIMMADKTSFVEFIPEFYKFFLFAIVPSALFPDKPINPAFDLAKAFGFGSSQAVSVSWLGGLMLYFNDASYILGPLILGFCYGIFSSTYKNLDNNLKVKYPLVYTAFLSFNGIVKEGIFHHTLLNGFIIISFVFILSIYNRFILWMHFLLNKNFLRVSKKHQ